MDTIYLDNCCFNRPYDDQSQLRIRIESEAKLRIQELIKTNMIKLVWSYMLDYENQQNPDKDRSEEIFSWESLASSYVYEDSFVLAKANEFRNLGIKRKDALHLGSAIKANCEYYITTDDGILNKKEKIKGIKIMNPVNYIIKSEGNYEK
jgi:predicted nucleic acid-binding protein